MQDNTNNYPNFLSKENKNVLPNLDTPSSQTISLNNLTGNEPSSPTFSTKDEIMHSTYSSANVNTSVDSKFTHSSYQQIQKSAPVSQFQKPLTDQNSFIEHDKTVIQRKKILSNVLVRLFAKTFQYIGCFLFFVSIFIITFIYIINF